MVREDATGGRSNVRPQTSGWHFLVQRVHQMWNSALQRWATGLPSVREALLLVVRAHLMLFYFEGQLSSSLCCFVASVGECTYIYWVTVSQCCPSIVVQLGNQKQRW
jgi:hypothetical protein